VNNPVLPRTLAVLSLDPNQKFGSLEEQTLIFARAFRDRGSAFVPVFVSQPVGPVAEIFRREGLAAEGLDLEAFRPGALRALVRLADRHAIELVHWNFYSPLTPYLFGVSALRPRVRHVFTQHGSVWVGTRPRSQLVRQLKAVLMRRYDAVLGVSDFVVRYMRDEWKLGRLGRFWHFVSLDRFRPDPVVRAELRREQNATDAFVVVAVGRLIPEKGFHLLIEAMASLPEDALLWVIGEGSQRSELEALISRLGLRDRVTLFGSRDRVEHFLQGADVATCPSTWEEAAGLVNLEASAVGLPSVASDNGGIPEFVRDGETGLLVPPGDATALAAALRTLYDDPERRRAMGAAARRFAESQFAVEEMVERNLAVYLPAR
jgi:glycosyltransferase involved in cell wall biosynthesis